MVDLQRDPGRDVEPLALACDLHGALSHLRLPISAEPATSLPPRLFLAPDLGVLVQGPTG